MSFSILDYWQKMLKNLFLITAILLFSADSVFPHSPRRVYIANDDCYFMKLGSSTVTYLDAGTPLIWVLAGGQLDSPDFVIPAQDGDSYFLQRFTLEYPILEGGLGIFGRFIDHFILVYHKLKQK